MKSKKYRRGYFWVAVAASLGCALFIFLVCTLPARDETSGYSISLTVDDKTHTEATFSGEPITAFLTFRDSVPDDIAWHIGLGQKLVLPYVKKDKELQAKLFWLAMPTHKDSATGKFYDSVYVSTGGEQYRSNSVRIFVTNLAPVIDSVKISSTTYKIDDTLRYSIKISDSLPTFLVRVFSHDLNKNVLSCSWSGAGTRLIPAIGTLNATYTIPMFNCFDTIGAEVYDGQGGEDTRVMIITTKKNANRAPVIDSISAKDTLFTENADIYYYSSAKLDSVKFKVSAHDSDLGDALFYQWTNKNLKQVVLRSAGTAATLVWACTSTTCRDTSKTLKAIDTVSVTVFDNDSARATKTIVIIKGALGTNKPPVFDSLMVNDTLFKGTWSIATRKATVRDTIVFRMFAHDPDSLDTIHFSVTAHDTLRIRKQGDTAAVYGCRDSVYRDTILFHLFDVHMGFVDKRVVIDVSNRYPIIDSVRMGDTTAKAADSACVKVASVKDSVVMTVFAHDPDKGDTIAAIRWLSAGASTDTSRFKKIIGTQATYVCKDSIFKDTCFIQVFDKEKAGTRKKVVVNVANRYPVIDSVRFGDTLFNTPDSASIRAFSARDTVSLRLFAHDPDAGDSITVRWRVADTSKDTLRLKNVSDTSCRYACKDTLYKDTCIVSVSDKRKKTAVKKLIVLVNNRYPLIDSVKCGDTLFKTKDSLYVRKATGGDTLAVRIFARDLDLGDALTDTVQSAGGAGITKLMPLQYQYVCQDSTFSDTLSASVKDKRQKLTQKKIKINITKK
jgi:hypothetical protein